MSSVKTAGFIVPGIPGVNLDSDSQNLSYISVESIFRFVLVRFDGKCRNMVSCSRNNFKDELQLLLDLGMILRLNQSYANPNRYLHPRRSRTVPVGYPLKAEFSNSSPIIIQLVEFTYNSCCKLFHPRSGARAFISRTSYPANPSRSEAPVGSCSWI